MPILQISHPRQWTLGHTPDTAASSIQVLVVESILATSLNGTHHINQEDSPTGCIPEELEYTVQGTHIELKDVLGSWLSQKNGVPLLPREWEAMASLVYIW